MINTAATDKRGGVYRPEYTLIEEVGVAMHPQTMVLARITTPS
jgi:hypothetical protein